MSKQIDNLNFWLPLLFQKNGGNYFILLLSSILLLLISNLIKSIETTTTTSDINKINQYLIETCQKDCPNRLNGHNELDITCNSTCRIQLCHIGCQYWYLSPGFCYKVCRNGSMLMKPFDQQQSHYNHDHNHQNNIVMNIWSTTQDNYCALGCNHAHTVYLGFLKQQLENSGALQAPRAKPNTITKDSLAIEWTAHLPPEFWSNLTYQIQWKYLNLPSQWTPVGMEGVRIDSTKHPITSSSSSKEMPSAHLVGLHSYTSYLFRLQWMTVSSVFNSSSASVSNVLWNSEPSQPITTLPYGIPLTPCIIKSCMPISSNQISVSWRAPLFPNGPIIAYSLYLKNEQTGYRMVKDIHTHRFNNEAIHNYVFNDLQPNTNYNLSILTHNNFGEGPQCSCQISTSSNKEDLDDINLNDSPMIDKEYESNEQEDHFKLYLASTKSVSRRNLDFLLEEEVLYHLTDYVENGEITGMAVHVAKRFLFVSDSSGSIRRILLKENSINQVLRIINGSNQPSHLSVDWLNDRLYWLEDSNRIMRCNLNGDAQQAVDTGTFWSNNHQKPIDFKVDPYNGYLFWLQANIFNLSAIYRLDLHYFNRHDVSGSRISNGNNLRSQIELIYQSDSWISTFAINYHNYRLVFPMGHTAAIHSITIDGNDETIIRDNSNQSIDDDISSNDGGTVSRNPFAQIENLVLYRNNLYGSSGENIVWEEFHPDEKIYYRNSHATRNRLIELAIMDQDGQPMPIPLTPVKNVEAIFLDTSAKIYWQKPALFGASGRGAWQQWRYEVAIKELSSQTKAEDVVHSAKVNNMTYCDLVELNPDTRYQIRVRAFTSAGKGAWSEPFIGRTLPSLDSIGSQRPYMLVASKDSGLIRADLDGKFKQQLISKVKFQQSSDFSINDIELYGDVIVINTNQNIMIYDPQQTNDEFPQLRTIVNGSKAYDIALEWMASKIYWSNPSERMICRCNINGSQIEILPIITYAQQLAIDSLHGFIYWSTLSSLRISLLNGMEHSQKWLLRHQKIKSLALDLNDSQLYWISEQQSMNNFQNSIDDDGHQAILMLNQMSLFENLEQVLDLNENGINDKSQKIQTYRLTKSINLLGPIAVFDQRFWWLNPDEHQIMISDHSLETMSTLRQVNDVNAFKVVIGSSEEMEKSKDYQVVPEPVDPGSIKIVGSLESFHIEWLPVTNVNYGRVFYELQILENENTPTTNTTLNKNNDFKMRWRFGRNIFILNETKFLLPENLKPVKPYSKIKISLRSFTYWASARQVVATLRTPSSIPSRPRFVRIYTYLMNNILDDLIDKQQKQLMSTRDQSQTITDQDEGCNEKLRYVAEARWAEPEHPNGQIQSYTVSLWTVAPGASSERVVSIINKVVDAKQLNYKLWNLKANCTYYFDVRATTDIGEGPASEAVQFRTLKSEPPMRILMSNSDQILEVDMDLLKSRSVIRSFSPSIMDYILADDKLFFIEDGNFLKSARLGSLETATDNSDSSLKSSIQVAKKIKYQKDQRILDNGQKGQSGNYTLLAHLPSTVTSISMDWLARRLYLSTVDILGNRSTIWWYHLETGQLHPLIEIINRYVDTVRVDPYRSQLVWTEKTLQLPSSILVAIRRCTLSWNGSFCLDQRNYFQTPSRDRLCNCTHTPNISPEFAMIATEVQQSIIYFDTNGQTFVQCQNGCYCQRITTYIDTQRSPISIELNQRQSRLYWRNDTRNGIIYMTQLPTTDTTISKTTIFRANQASIEEKRRNQIDFRQQLLQVDMQTPIRSLLQLQLQPYPMDFECLIPPKDSLIKMRMIQVTSNKLTLKIDIKRHQKILFESNNCWSNNKNLTLAPILYRIQYKIDNINNISSEQTNLIDCSNKNNSQCGYIETYNETLIITDLDPFTNYSFSVQLDNYYLQLLRNQTKKQLEFAQNASLVSTVTNSEETDKIIEQYIRRKYPYLYADEFRFATEESRPSPPSNVRAIVESPEKIQVLWNEPEKLNTQQVAYEVRWIQQQQQHLPLSKKNFQLLFNGNSLIKWWNPANALLNGSYWIYLEKIKPGKWYNITVRAYSVVAHPLESASLIVDYKHFQDSEPIIARSYDEPSDLKPIKFSAKHIELTWQSPRDPIIDSHELWYQSIDEDKIKKMKNKKIIKRSKIADDVDEDRNWIKFTAEDTKPDHQYRFEMKNLRPYTWYQFRMNLTYRPSKAWYEWPKEPKHFLFQTKMSVPDGPEKIQIEWVNRKQQQPVVDDYNLQHEYFNRRDDPITTPKPSEINHQGYKMVWDAVRSNSPCKVYYQLYGWSLISNENKTSSSDYPSHNDHPSTKWTLVYNGTQTYWLVGMGYQLKSGVRYHFRLYASNCVGRNEQEWAQTIRPFYLGQPLDPTSMDLDQDSYHDGLFYSSSSNPGLNHSESHTLYAIFALLCMTAISLIIFSLCSVRFYKMNAKKLPSKNCNSNSNGATVINSESNLSNSMVNMNDIHQMELTPWQQIPQPHLENMLYVNSQLENIDLSDIEVFDYRSITLIKLLGRGAFGEVHEAILHKNKKRVAVKLLNTNTSKEEENCNFLKEAKFMSKFKHPHILQLLGVCLNHHSSCSVIILELMEAGDLLKYLRANRPKHSISAEQSTLSIDDLLSICIDVAKGCEYLEQKQFVHRDLAARNCLVSSTDPTKRVVKIADFGLSRGLYNQNYYRKEGGLMPVRWMSPESLSDGVFTTQSDVWSFSVIMYEVMTLGQQPYQAYSNKEVLEYVKNGGTLERPPLCPIQLYTLMKMCWQYEKESRPSFSNVLRHLQRIREQIQRQTDSLMHLQAENNQQHLRKNVNVMNNHNYPKSMMMFCNEQVGNARNYNNLLDQQVDLMLTMPIDGVRTLAECQGTESAYCNAILPNTIQNHQNLVAKGPESTSTINGYRHLPSGSMGYSVVSTTLTSLDDQPSSLSLSTTEDDGSTILSRNEPPALLKISPTLVLHSDNTSRDYTNNYNVNISQQQINKADIVPLLSISNPYNHFYQPKNQTSQISRNKNDNNNNETYSNPLSSLNLSASSINFMNPSNSSIDFDGYQLPNR